MTGTPLNLAEEQTFALDPGPRHAEVEQQCEPILAACELEREERVRESFSAVRREASPSLTGYTMATLCQMHLAEPKLATRGAILAKGIVTKVDAIAAVDLVAELDGDAELVDHLLVGLRSFLLVD